MFTKVLIANRGEIAVRIVRALDELGVASVAVYSELDRDAPHVTRADEAYNLGDGPAARELPERREDPRRRRRAPAPRRSTPATGSSPRTHRSRAACEEAGVVFIGPPAERDRGDGLEDRARELMQAAGVPIVPGTTEPVADDRRRAADRRGGHRLPGRRQGGRWRRRQGLSRGAGRGGAGGGVRGGQPRGREVLLRRRPSTSSATCPTRATSRCRCSPTATAT